MFEISFTRAAIQDLKRLRKSERRRIIDGLESKLGHDPNVETRNRKRLRPNELAEWALRIGSFRVFYDVSEGERQVSVEAVGRKDRDRLYIGGKEYEI